MRSGLIIAGGRSERFGSGDKAVAPLAGTPMIRRVGDRLRPIVDELVVNCRPDQVATIRDALEGVSPPLRIAPDEEPDRGPMAGIHDGLAAVNGEYVAVVACDMPFVEPEIVSYLFDRAEGHDAAVPRLDDKWYETTHAVYRTEPMHAACDAALSDGKRRIVEPLSDLDYVIVDEAEITDHGSRRSFENLNTREEFEAAAARLS